MFASGPLVNGRNTVTATLIGGGTFFVDYLQFLPLEPSEYTLTNTPIPMPISHIIDTTTMAPVPGFPSSSQIPAGQGEITSSGTTTASPTTGPGAVSDINAPTGAPQRSNSTRFIAGGVAAGVAILLLALIGAFFVLRRRRSKVPTDTQFVRTHADHGPPASILPSNRAC